MTNAYELLSNPEKRKQYDDFKVYGGSDSPFSGFRQTNTSNKNTGFGNNTGNFWKGSDYSKWSQQRDKY